MKRTKIKHEPRGAVTEKWNDLIAQWKKSGTSQSAFCRENKIKPSTFSWRVRQFRSEAVVLSGTASVELVQIERVNLTRPSRSVGVDPHATTLTLVFNGMELQFHEQLNPQRLKAFLFALRSS